MNNERIVLKKNNFTWQDINFSDLKDGDIFSLFEPSGEQVVGNNGEKEFIATSDAFLNDDGIWSVNIHE